VVWTVSIVGGVFGANVPVRYLSLSPELASICNVLIPVKHLICTATIAQLTANEVAYYRIELDRHDVLLGCVGVVHKG
jgi:hypothetical protein